MLLPEPAGQGPQGTCAALTSGENPLMAHLQAPSWLRPHGRAPLSSRGPGVVSAHSRGLAPVPRQPRLWDSSNKPITSSREPGVTPCHYKARPSCSSWPLPRLQVQPRGGTLQGTWG